MARGSSGNKRGSSRGQCDPLPDSRVPRGAARPLGRADQGGLVDSSVLHSSWPRAAANALWKPLRHAHLDGWPLAPTDWRVNDPTGNPQSGRHSTTPPTPGPIPRTEPITELERVIGIVEPGDWPGEVTLSVRLTREAHDLELAKVGTQTRYEYSRALRKSNALAPFIQTTNRHGSPALRRNPEVAALITPLVAALLEALARAAHVEVVTGTLEEALLTERDIRRAELEGMRASEVLAIGARAD